MKFKKIFFIAFICGISQISCGKGDDFKGVVNPEVEVVTSSFSEVWKFHAGKGVETTWAATDYDDSSWATVSSSTKLSEQGQKTEDRYGWYRKSIVIPDSLKSAIIKSGAFVMDFGKFASADEVYWNGVLVGKTGGFPPNFNGTIANERRYLVESNVLDLNGKNQIAIKFYEGWTSGGFLGGSSLKISSASSNDMIIVSTKVNDSDYIFLGNDPLSITVSLENKNEYAVDGNLVVKITTDAYEPVKVDSVDVSVDGAMDYQNNFVYDNPNPGFYRYTITFQRRNELVNEEKFNVGYEPEKIESPIDAKPDFESFWENNLAELAKVDPQYTMTLLPESSKLDYNIYLVEMYSFENELIRGYYGQPKRSGTFPIVVEYMGYGSEPYLPTQTWDGFAHFVLSVRGQALNKPTNRFGTWVTYGAASKETYYYRGAFLDVVRAVDFVCSRPEIDTTKIGVRGGSQGGALSFVAAALDKRVKVAAPSIPFLSDYPDYFKIGPWPKSDFDSYMRAHPKAKWDEIYEMLSYFDIKNLAQWITCPIYMGMGVQDNVCPPHINFSAYNQVKSEKHWMACPECGHSTNAAYWSASVKFIKEKLGVK